jgi:hypothetical protein
MKLTISTVALCILVWNCPHAEIAIGDTFVPVAGYSDITGMSGGGTTATEVLDSIVIRNDTIRYIFSIVKTSTGGFFEMGGTMKPLIYSKSSTLAVLNKTPSNIGSHSSSFDNAQWILGKESDFLFYPDLQKAAPYWLVPINPTGQAYALTDYYVVRVSDSIGIKWMRDTTATRKFFGKFIRYQNKNDSVGSVIPDTVRYFTCGVVPSWTATDGTASGNNNPFGLLNVGAASWMYPLKSETLSMGQGCYGNQISKYLHGPSIHSIVPTQRGARAYGPSEVMYYNLLGKRLNCPLKGNFPMLLITKMNGPLNSKPVIRLKFR